jgi:PAS domain S-box-containing protein
MTSPQAVFLRYQDLQRYVSWTADDERRVKAAAPLIAGHINDLVADFYAEIERHPMASRVITGGPAQVERLKATLVNWLRELLAGPYDASYVARRWQVGLKHVEIGLPQVYTAAALSRLRNGIIGVLCSQWRSHSIDGIRESYAELTRTVQALNKLLDLDQAIIGDAYETEHVHRQQEAERRRLHDALHQEKELSAGLLAHAQAAVLVLDRQGRIVRCNPFVERLAGREHESVQDQDWFELFLDAAERERLRPALLFASGAESLEPVTTTSLLESDAGRKRRIHWSGVPLRDAAGQSFGVLVIGHDITDRMRPSSGPCKPSASPRSARWPPASPTKAATPCSGSARARRCLSWNWKGMPRRSAWSSASDRHKRTCTNCWTRPATMRLP